MDEDTEDVVSVEEARHAGRACGGNPTAADRHAKGVPLFEGGESETDGPLLQAQPKLPPVPELRYAEDAKPEGAPTERVMSEYERQMMIARRERRLAGLIRLVRNVVLTGLLVVIAYAVAGFVAFVHLPPKIADIEGRIAGSLAEQEAKQQSRDILRGLKAKSGVDTSGENKAKQLAAFAALLESKAFAALEKQCGMPPPPANMPRLSAVGRKLLNLDKEVAQKENRISMYNREFAGPTGKGSPGWQAKMAKVRAELSALRKQCTDLERTRDTALDAARERLQGVERALAPSQTVSPAEQERLETMRTWRDRLKIWPLPRFEHLFTVKE